ncbi:MAG: histidinol-phosphate transaminase [Burkholderiaceae bacterium]|nr:histidinol-phosphate transaminase [Burkholderiaceae bacterium]
MSTAAQAGLPAQVVEALPYVRAIAPYQAGKPIEETAREHGLRPETIVKLASNENPLGMPASARAAIEAALPELGRYPDSNGFELKAALSRKLGVPADWITLGNGSNDILEAAAAVMLAPGRSCVYAQHSFAVYPLATQARGARSIVVAARDYGHDLDAMLAAIEADTRLVFVANPNNPTGTFVGADAMAEFLARVPRGADRMAEFLARVPRHVVVVLDEAYNEYLPPELRHPSVDWVRRFPNLLLSRSFSKAYGLAGLRIGYGVAQPELTDLLNRVRQPFNCNSLAQAAAVAALADQAFVERSVEVNRRGMAQVTAAFDTLGLRYLPSFGNFVLVQVGDGAAVYQGLLRRGVIVRPVANYGLPQWLRVTIGLPEENDRFITALRDVLQGAGA